MTPITSLLIMSAAVVQSVANIDPIDDTRTVAAIIGNGNDRLIVACGGRKPKIFAYIETKAYLYTRRAGQLTYRIDDAKPSDELWAQESHRAETRSAIDAGALAMRLVNARRILIRMYETTDGPQDIAFDFSGVQTDLRLALNDVAVACNSKWLRAKLQE